MSDTTVIYHKGCSDGFGAAYCFWKKWQTKKGIEIEFYPGIYGEYPPNLRDRDIFLVDFCYKEDGLDYLCSTARSVTIIDHHVTAEAEVQKYKTHYHNPTPLHFIYDVEKSGAMLAWEFCYGKNVTAPKLIQHIQDRDLWKFEMTGTREIIMSLFTYDFNFETWDELMLTDPEVLRQEGAVMTRKYEKDKARILSSCKRNMMIGDYFVPVVNCPGLYSSDIGNQLAQENAFAATYSDGPDYRLFSLRSDEDGVDVSVVAQQFGGGGHKHAAGFRVPRDHPLAKV